MANNIIDQTTNAKNFFPMKLSPVGVGCYRFSIKSKEHEECLNKAIDLGCNLIDTSSNYTHGDSELLIGKVLDARGLSRKSAFQNERPLIVTKAGYVQSPNLKVLSNLQLQGKAKEDLVDLGDDLKHTIHPDYLEQQITQSLARLKVEELDVFLLHNPEYFFKDPAFNALTKEEAQEKYLTRLRKAFHHLEEEVFRGRIKSYGISSNTFAIDPASKDKSHVDIILKTAESVSKNHHLKVLQFPLNLLERGALDKNLDGLNLFQFAKQKGLLTLANRPLNAFSPSGFVRIAQYDNSIPDQTMCNALLEDALDSLNEEIQNNLEEENGLLVSKTKSSSSGQIQGDVRKIPIVQQLTKIWLTLPTPDAVDQVFLAHFFPLVSQIYGRNLSFEESKGYYRLYEIAEAMARRQMTNTASNFRTKLEVEGIIQKQAEIPLSVLAVQKYLDWGVNHVLVGMKRMQYVQELQHFFL